MVHLKEAVAWMLLAASATTTTTTKAFVLPSSFHSHPATTTTTISTSSPNSFLRSLPLSSRKCTSTQLFSTTNNNDSTNPKTLLVISPAGGIGEVTAVQAAQNGATVKWFVISPPTSPDNKTTSKSSITFSSQTLEQISQANGSVQLAGADAESLLLNSDDNDNALQAMKTWCGKADGMVCTYDGIDSIIRQSNLGTVGSGGWRVGSGDKEEMDGRAKKLLVDAIRVAVAQVAESVGGNKVVVLSASEGMEEDEFTSFALEEEDGGEEDGGGEGGGGASALLGSLFGGTKVAVPSSLKRGARGKGGGNVVVLRYGELFGVPDSSPDCSPFVGGPRRDPVLRDEYTMRSIRIDPTLSLSGNSMMDGSTRSSRLSIGQAAALMAISPSSSSSQEEQISITPGMDVCLTSLRGSIPPTQSDYTSEFTRVAQSMNDANDGTTRPTLFSAPFGSVPSIERLADWLATKWAPAVLRTYDIAGIRVGARPVYASRTGEGTVEIVWQQLVEFRSVNAGRMVIEVTEEGLSAFRGAGDAVAGYGSVSRKPLAGEDILVRRLADAATQAVEKGLASKPAPAKRPKKEVVEAAVTTTMASSGTVQVAEPAAVAATPKMETGPRSAGARRSSERTRGKRRKAAPVVKEDGDASSSSSSSSEDSFQ